VPAGPPRHRSASYKDEGTRMENVWFLASLWVGLALIATLIAIWLKISTALSEIVVGTVAQLIVGVAIGRCSL
jgi:glutathione-regulated potassium-efflux system ancillary protein KefC